MTTTAISPRGADLAAPGRPRSAAVDEAILRAAFTLFIERGIAGASIERIARRAGVGKASIYRRWPSRDALLAQAIERARNESAGGYSVEAVERASPRDFFGLLLGVGEVLARPEIRRLMTRLIGTVPDHPRLLELYRETYFAARRRAVVGALRRVKDAGALPAEADPDLLVDMLAGALIYRVLFAPDPNDTPEAIRAYVRRLLAAAGFDVARLEKDWS
jgi:AcrR family transcriptional regulator